MRARRGGLRFVLHLAWRESWAARRRLLILVAAIAVGVAALVAINSFTDNVRDAVRVQAKALLGADLAFSGRRAFDRKARATFDSVARLGGGAVSIVTSFSAMAYVPRTEGARLVQVTAIDGGYPFYGEVTATPAAAWGTLQDGMHAVVDPSLLTALNARVGDTLALGEGRLLITGTLTGLPGDVGIRSAFGPRIFIPGWAVPRLDLLGFGARVEYEAFIRLADGVDAQRIADQLRPTLRPERIRVRTVAEERADISETLDKLGRYLGLVALIALLLGGIGVASAVHVFVRQKLETIAVLRCLGATAGRVFAIYLVQAAGLGLLGAILGVGLGVLLQQALPVALGQAMPSAAGQLLPAGVGGRPSPWAVVTGLGIGVWVAVIFALLPLLGVRQISPLAALRRPYDTAAPPARDPLRWPAALALALSVVALAGIQSRDWRVGAAFAGGIALTLLVLWLAARALMWAVRRWFPARWPYVWRQGLANLYRPANQTVTVILALGFGAFLLSTLFLVQHNFLRQLRIDGTGARPNLVLFDIQSDQRDAVLAAAKAGGATVSRLVPIVPMRILSVKGRAVTDILGDSTARRSDGQPFSGWPFRREYRSTYRDSLTTSETLAAGTWWKAPRAPGDSIVPISVELGLATELDVTIGDEIVWDVQGVPLRSRIASLREVDWARFEPNFFVVFAPGALEHAPQTWATLGRLDDPAALGRLQRVLAERFPNVTSLDLSLVVHGIEQIIGRIALAIRFMAVFSLATGAAVLIGAVTTSRFQRLREGAILKTLGATRRQVLQVSVAEYLSLGLLAAASSIVLASVAGWALARWVFEFAFSLPLLALSALAAGGVALTVGVGLWNSREVVAHTPLEVLRAE
ncbi:MAG: ABC transporter permease [Gemmatimonadota bacterium]